MIQQQRDIKKNDYTLIINPEFKQISQLLSFALKCLQL